jgi:hypothetical protein
MLNSNLDTVLKELRERQRSNRTRPAQQLKPDSEDAIINAVLILSDELEKLAKRCRVIDERVSLAPGAKRVHTRITK